MYTVNPRELDVILMDVQMPVMDGLEASKMIRKYEEAHKEAGHVQIIGITAHVLIMDRNMCIEAGLLQ